jgi:hypothetical protein
MPDKSSIKTKIAAATVILKFLYLLGLGGDNWFCGKYGGGLFIKLYLFNHIDKFSYKIANDLRKKMYSYRLY